MAISAGRLAGFVFALALAVLVAACGSDVISFDTVANASVETQEAGTARVTLDVAVTFGHDHAKRVRVTGGGVVDFERSSARVKVNYAFRDDIQEILEHRFGGKPSAELIMDGRKGLVLYVRFSFLRDELPPGKKWFKADLQKIGEKSGVDVREILQASQSDPDEMLTFLERNAEVEKVGTDLVRRELTTHYTTTVDAHEVAATAPPEQRKAMEESMRLTGIETYPIEVWVDRYGLLRKLVLDLEWKQPETGWVQMVITEELYDFGVDVDIEAPPARRVLDITKLAARCLCRS